MRALPDPELLKSPHVHCLSSFFPRLLSFPGTPVELLDIPKRVMVQNAGSKIAQAGLCSHQDVRTSDADNGKAGGYQFLYPVIEALAFREVQGAKLLAHQAVHFRFPRSRRPALAGVPHVSAAT